MCICVSTSAWSHNVVKICLSVKFCIILFSRLVFKLWLLGSLLGKCNLICISISKHIVIKLSLGYVSWKLHSLFWLEIILIYHIFFFNLSYIFFGKIFIVHYIVHYTVKIIVICNLNQLLQCYLSFLYQIVVQLNIVIMICGNFDFYNLRMYYGNLSYHLLMQTNKFHILIFLTT